jgi:hypothetical protein
MFRIISKNDTTNIKNFNGNNGIVMRHDIDISLNRTMAFAKIESEYKINSTYYVMTTSPTYNVHTLDNRKRIRDIIDMGFDVGLHFDTSVYSKDNLEKHLEDEIHDLSVISGIDIASYSIHNPSLMTSKFHSNKFKDAWSNIFEGNYFADSRMILPNNFVKLINKSKICPVQIALHPEHYSENGDGYDKIFTNILLDFAIDMDSAFSVNSTYVKEVGSMADKVKIHTVRAVL